MSRAKPDAEGSFLVVRGKKTDFDPDNPNHIRWLELMVALMGERLRAKNPKAFQPYPPAFDEGVTESQFMAWDEQAREVNGMYLARNVWTLMRTAAVGRKEPSPLSESEIQAGVVPLGLMAGLKPTVFKTKAQKALMEAFLAQFELRLGMNTQAWLEVRQKMLVQASGA